MKLIFSYPYAYILLIYLHNLSPILKLPINILIVSNATKPMRFTKTLETKVNILSYYNNYLEMSNS